MRELANEVAEAYQVSGVTPKATKGFVFFSAKEGQGNSSNELLSLLGCFSFGDLFLLALLCWKGSQRFFLVCCFPDWRDS